MANKPNYIVSGFSLDHIRNNNELRVIEVMKQVIPEAKDFCGCRICVEDTYAATLSRLPNQYRQSGSIVLTKSPNDDEIGENIRWAMEKITANPTHAPGEVSA